jgi:hypothetical protein
MEVLRGRHGQTQARMLVERLKMETLQTAGLSE